jgi:hypothetical protein
MRQRLMSGWIAIAIGLTVAPLIAADDGDNNPVASPTTRPAAATQPVPRTDLATVRKWVIQLASDNYQTRNAARVALMGLKRYELGTLRQAVKASLPLAPDQIIAIREVFTQVYLAGDVYIPNDADGGFLGIRLPIRPEEETLYAIERGVVIVARVPGFCAFRMLQDGDVILAIHSDAGDRALNDPDELSRAVSSFKAGTTITLEVLRQGQILHVPVTLDRRPLKTRPSELPEFVNDRADRADEAWGRDFAPLLENQLLS